MRCYRAPLKRNNIWSFFPFSSCIICFRCFHHSGCFFGAVVENRQRLLIHFAWLPPGQQTYRNKVLVPPRFTCLNVQGGANPPRDGAAATWGPWVQQMASGYLLEQSYLYKHILALGSLRTPRQQKKKFMSPQIFPAQAPVFVLEDKDARQVVELSHLNVNNNNTADVFRPRICKYWLLEKFPALNLISFFM